jgi:hypothetical protein
MIGFALVTRDPESDYGRTSFLVSGAILVLTMLLVLCVSPARSEAAAPAEAIPQP